MEVIEILQHDIIITWKGEKHPIQGNTIEYIYDQIIAGYSEGEIIQIADVGFDYGWWKMRGKTYDPVE